MGERNNHNDGTCDYKIHALDRRIDQRFEDLETRLDERFETQKDSLRRESAGLNLRLEGMNEFREQLKAQAATFITVPMHDALRDRITKLERWPWLFSLISGLVGAVGGGTIIMIVMKLLGSSPH